MKINQQKSCNLKNREEKNKNVYSLREMRALLSELVYTHCTHRSTRRRRERWTEAEKVLQEIMASPKFDGKKH